MQFLALIDLWSTTVTTFLVLLFLRALFHKVSDLFRFTGFLGNYNILPESALTVGAYGLMASEALTIVLLIVPQFNQFGATLAIGILLLYAAVIGLNVSKGNFQIECGCGGPAMHLSYGLVLRNLLIAIMALPMLLSIHNEISLVDTVVAAACGAILYSLYVVGEQLAANSNQAHFQGSFQ